MPTSGILNLNVTFNKVTKCMSYILSMYCKSEGPGQWVSVILINPHIRPH